MHMCIFFLHMHACLNYLLSNQSSFNQFPIKYKLLYLHTLLYLIMTMKIPL